MITLASRPDLPAIPMIEPRTMPGVLELLPLEQVRFQRMADTIRSGFERFGFLPIETPAIELTEVLLTKTGGETEKQVYFVQSTGSREQGDEPDLALRFDLTVSLARYVAEHEQSLSFPFRRYQIERVYRGESPQRGRFREFYQCDIDVIGREELSVRYDAEMPAVIERVFDDLDIGEFTIRINNRRFMRGILEDLGVSSEAGQKDVLREIDKLEKRGAEAVAGSLRDLGMDGAAVDRLLALTTLRVMGQEALSTLDDIPPGGELTESGRLQLREVVETMADLGVPDHRYCLDLSIARGLDYYTGTIYETVLDDHPGIGSVCSGGRYDDLASLYTSTRLPGVGLSIGLTRLFWQLREAGLLPEPRSTVLAYVTLMDADGLAYALRTATALREAGIPTEAALEPARLGKQLKHAARTGIRFAVIAGSDERATGTVTLRDLDQQSQVEVKLEEAADHILSAPNRQE